MSLNNFIISLLILLPIIPVFTDFKYGKIKNYFVFPYLFLLIILSFFIEWFFLEKLNIISFIILLLLWFIFYKNNKWGAWDWKYLIILWYSLIIISYLKGFTQNALIYFIMLTFLLFLIYNFFYILFNIKKIKKLKINYKINLDKKNDLYVLTTIYILIFWLSYFLWDSYNYILIFLLIFLVVPYLNLIKIFLIRSIISLIWLALIIYNFDYLLFSTLIIFYYSFSFLQKLFDQIYDKIDCSIIWLKDLKSGDILTENWVKKINDDIWLVLYTSPLQGIDIFNIIWEYKEKKFSEFLNWKIEIYKDIKIGIFFYLGFVISLAIFYLK